MLKILNHFEYNAFYVSTSITISISMEWVVFRSALYKNWVKKPCQSFSFHSLCLTLNINTEFKNSKIWWVRPYWNERTWHSGRWRLPRRSRGLARWVRKQGPWACWQNGKAKPGLGNLSGCSVYSVQRAL